MRLTRRGWTVAGIGVGAFLLALGFGPRSLNAVVVPAVVVLAAGYVQVRFLGDVTVLREPPGDDYVGSRGVTTLRFQTPAGSPVDRPFVATVRERVGEGVRVVPTAEAVADRTAGGDEGTFSEYAVGSDERGAFAAFETAVGGDCLAYCVEYERRGERAFGPLTITARDVFGLVEEDTQLRGTDRVLVFPRVRRLAPWGHNPLHRLEAYGRSRQREEFEELREYSPGDPLRDIHWKTTAKREELVVKEFAAEAEAEMVTLSGGATNGADDELAEAVASVAFALVEQGIPVEVSTVRGTVEVGPERGGVRRLLRMLAVVTPGQVPDPEADVVVHATDARTTVRVIDREVGFADLVSTPASAQGATDDWHQGEGGTDGRDDGGDADGTESDDDAASVEVET